MKRYPPTSPLVVLFARFATLLLLFLLTRFIFYWFNIGEFETFSSEIFWEGLRFDTAAICLLNSIYFVCLLLPFRFVESKIFRKIGNVYYIVVNAIALLTNLIDTCYYPYSMRRMTGDIFSFVGETNNIGQLIPVFIKDFWYVAVIWLALIGLLLLSAWLTEKTDYGRMAGWWKHIVLRLCCLFLIFTGARGGWQLRPLNISFASSAAGVENAALVLNSPYSLITTLDSHGLKRMHYFTDEEGKSIFSTQRHFTEKNTFIGATNFPYHNGIVNNYSHPINVVLIILEGISSEYSEYLADEPKPLAGFTPFLDSLAQQSIVFRGYANGQQSIEALSSILGGIPSLMEKPFSQSRYAAYNIQYAIPALKPYNMRTMFFHGGQNGTMGFDRFCKMNGIDQYFGMDEYDPSRLDEDYDGTWGISDVPYLQYVANKLSGCADPFFATIFTLSSHHPFKVPKDYDNVLPKGEIPMQHCVAYTDEALRQFFARAKKTYWYPNTLFVITADHTNFHGATDVDYFAHRYSVPMIFFYPKADTSYRSNQIVQQVDIMPSIIDYCGFSADFSSFGHSAFDKSAPHFAINYLSGSYELYIDNYLIEFDGNVITHVYDATNGYKEVNPKSVPGLASSEKLLKAVIQRFNNGLLDNSI